MMRSADTLFSNSATVGTKINTGNGTLAFTAGLPISITSGNATFEMAQSVSLAGDIEVASVESSLANTARQFDIGIYYDFLVSDGVTVSTYGSLSRNYQNVSGAESSTFGVSFGLSF